MATKKRAQSSGRKRAREAARRRAAAKRLIIFTGVILVLACALIIAMPRRSHVPIDNFALQRAGEPARQEMEILAAPAAPTATAEPAPTAAPAIQTLESQPAREAAPAAPFEYLPVYRRADTLERKIAITVDDCFQLNNLQTIAKLASQYHGRLTIFPIGKNIAIPGMAETLKACAFKLGDEIENHTWSHARIFRLSEYEMAEEIFKQSEAVNQALGRNYEQHFLRLMGGDGASDQRIHNYLKQLGYRGIAEWSVSGSDLDLNAIKGALAPGAIYLFHTTDGDTAKLRQFIPYVASQKYQMVTLNELLGLADNAVAPYAPRTMPVPQAYAEDYSTHTVGDYAWNVVRIQETLVNQGYLRLDGPATGYYGEQTAEAVARWQADHGLPATGTANEATLRQLLS